MSDTTPTTDRRAFLKAGAVVAVPLAAAAPVAALAADESRARLARLEDERALEALQRKFLRYLNGQGECGEFVAPADAVELGAGLRSIAEDLGHEPSVELADDGLSATTRCPCRIEREAEFAGGSTLERMARFQGHGSHRFDEDGVLTTKFAKTGEGWRIVRARLV